MSAQFYTIAVWCTLYDCWGSLTTSDRKQVIEELAQRMTSLLPVQVRIIETESGDDDEIVPKLLKLKRPPVRNVDDPSNHGFMAYSVFDELE